MESSRRQLSGGVRGSFGEARGIEGEEEREEQYQQILALLGAGLEGVFPLSVGESGSVELVRGDDLGNNFRTLSAQVVSIEQ